MSFRWRETHHLWYGIILVVLSFFWGGYWVCIPGLILVADDLLQHFAGVDPSPIHQLYVKYLWPIPVVQRLNKWLDNLFKET